MYLTDGGFSTLTILRVNGETALEGDGVVILVSLTSEDEILLSGQLTVEAIYAEMDAMRAFLHRREQQLRFTY